MGWVGKQIGPGSSFHVLRKLSADDLGKTFEARDKRDGALIVLKALRRSLGRNKEAVARLEAEIKAQVKLSHKGLALYRGSFRVGDAVVVYRPYAVGASLDSILSESSNGVPINRIHNIFGGLLDALAFAHDADLPHLALSPRVIYVGPESKKSPPCIIDFGLPRVVGPTTYARVYTDSPYLAPEQRSSASQADHRADIYTMGVLLREALTGKSSPKARNDAIPDDLNEVIRRATSSDPSRRFQNARTFRRALEGRDELIATPHAAPAVQDGDNVDEESSGDEVACGAEVMKLAAILVRPRVRASSGRLSNRDRQTRDTGNYPSAAAEPVIPVEKWAYAPTEEWAHSPTPILNVPALVSLGAHEAQAAEHAASANPHMGLEAAAGLSLSGSLNANGNGAATPVAGFNALAEPALVGDDAVTEKLEIFDGLTFHSDILDELSDDEDSVDLGEFGDVEEPDEDDEVESGTFTPAFGLPVLTELLARGNAARRAIEKIRSGASEAAIEPTTVLEPQEQTPEISGESSTDEAAPEKSDEPRGDSVEWVLFSGDLEPVSDDDIAELERIGADDILDILAVSSPRLAISATEFESGAQVRHITKKLSKSTGHQPVRTVRKHSRALRLSATLALVTAAALMLAMAVPPLVAELQTANEPTGAELVDVSLAVGEIPATTVESPADDTVAELAVTPRPELSLPVVLPPSDVLASTHQAGSLQFGVGLWQEGNSWTFHLVGDASDAGAEVDYFVNRRITAIAPHPWGRRVTIVDSGGTAEPRTRELYVSAACVIDPETERIVFCVPQEQTDLEARIAVGADMSVFETTRGAVSMLFDPNLGWVEESSNDGLGRRVTSQLVGYRVGDISGGEADLPVITCAWTESIDKGTGIGRTDRRRGLSTLLRRAVDWGVEGRLRHVDLPLGVGADSSRLEAFYSRYQTAYLVSGDASDQAGQAPELVDLPLDQVSIWRSNDDATTHVALLFQRRGAAHVRLLTFTPGQRVVEQALVSLPEREGSRTRLSMTANSVSCGVEVRHQRQDSTDWASYSLSDSGAERLGGTL